MFFNLVKEAPPDPIFGLTNIFHKDDRSNKIDLLVGIYKNEHLKAELFASIKQAKEQIVSSDLLADYLPMDGLAEFSQHIGELVFSPNVWKRERERIFAMQSLGGTGALRVGAELLSQEVSKRAAIPDLTWPNHLAIFERAGFDVETYPYYNRKTRRFDVAAMCKKLEMLPEKTVVVLHASCHNPSGRDPTRDEWRQISGVLKKRRLVPFFDCAYQGLGSGLSEDVDSIRLFLEEGQEMLIAYSCSKNFSLYSQRVGALFIVTGQSIARVVGSQAKRISRAMYSNPPAHGARIALRVLENASLRELWEEELNQARLRLSSTRDALIEQLCQRCQHVDFSYLRGHVGLFMLLDLSKLQAQRLIDEFGIYLLETGRLSVAGINRYNIDYIAESIARVFS